MRKSSWETHNENVSVRANLSVMKRAAVIEIVESRMAKIHKMIKAEVVETTVEMYEDALQSRYYELNKGIESVMFNIVEHALNEIAHAD